MTKSKFSVNHLSVRALDEIFERIRQRLKEKGINQKKLSELLQVSEPTVSRIMSKGRRMSVDMLLKIADILEIDARSLLPGDNPTIKPEFEDYMWETFKTRLDKYLREREREREKG